MVQGHPSLLCSVYGKLCYVYGTRLKMLYNCLCADLATSALSRMREVCEIVSKLLMAHIPSLLLSAIMRLILRAYKILISATRLHIAPKGEGLLPTVAMQQCE